MEYDNNTETLANNGFTCPEFENMTLDQWCTYHLKGLERADVKVENDGGSLRWTYRGQDSKNSLSEALGHGFPALERKQYVFLKLDTIGEDQFADIAAQLASRLFSALLLCVESPDRDTNPATAPSWISLEKALFAHGLQKHAAYYELSGPARQTGCSSTHYGCYINLTSTDCEKYDLAFLATSRDLHMDMLREAGPRSDAHVMRYHFAAKRIVAEVGRGGRILDACCGMGYGTRLLHQFCQPSHVVGVDRDDRAIEYASCVFAIDEQIAFVASDLLQDLQSREAASLDAIVMFEGLEHVDQVGEILDQANRVLKPTGLMISSVLNSWVNQHGQDENPWHKTVFQWDNYRAVLSNHLTIDTMLCQIGNRYNEAGKWHEAEPRFEQVDIASFQPDNAEWWLAVCRPKSLPGIAPHDPMSNMSFDLQEALAELEDPAIKVVSFDIFDTLLARPTIAPDDVFRILQQSLVEQRGELFSDFAKLRMLAEKNARQIAHQKGLGDITFDEIYDCLASLMMLNHADMMEIKTAELALEEQLLKPRLGAKK